MARIISIMNQKGGVGKTTTTLNLGAALAQKGKNVLLVDLDPQANLTCGLGTRAKDLSSSVYELLTNKNVQVASLIQELPFEGLFLVPSHIDLSGAEIELVPMMGRESRLRRALDPVRETFDYILIDCLPSLSLLTVNAMVASHELFVPLQAHPFALEGLGKLFEIAEMLREALNPDLKLTGVLVTLYDSRTNVSRETLKRLRGDERLAPHIFDTLVRSNVKIAESQKEGIPVIHFDPRSAGAQAYLRLCEEVLEMEASGCRAGEAWQRIEARGPLPAGDGSQAGNDEEEPAAEAEEEAPCRQPLVSAREAEDKQEGEVESLRRETATAQAGASVPSTDGATPRAVQPKMRARVGRLADPRPAQSGPASGAALPARPALNEAPPAPAETALQPGGPGVATGPDEARVDGVVAERLLEEPVAVAELADVQGGSAVQESRPQPEAQAVQELQAQSEALPVQVSQAQAEALAIQEPQSQLETGVVEESQPQPDSERPLRVAAETAGTVLEGGVDSGAAACDAVSGAFGLGGQSAASAGVRDPLLSANLLPDPGAFAGRAGHPASNARPVPLAASFRQRLAAYQAQAYRPRLNLIVPEQGAGAVPVQRPAASEQGQGEQAG